MRFWLAIAMAGILVAACRTDKPSVTSDPAGAKQSFSVSGIVRRLSPDDLTVVIAHDEIPNYMPAMTMPFKVRQTNDLAGLNAGDEIKFRLLVNDDESWIDRIQKTGKRYGVAEDSISLSTNTVQITSPNSHPLMDYQFTNQLGQPVSLNQFKGQALAITFIFTRCPIPEYCPRLSKNFAEASRKLAAMPDAPTNWHFLSITFDPAYDTPEILHSYAASHQYDPRHWSFLTGDQDKIGELAKASGVMVRPEGNTFDHSFRTLIINTKGQLQMSFPVSGDLSDSIVGEMLKAVAVTNQP